MLIIFHGWRCWGLIVLFIGGGCALISLFLGGGGGGAPSSVFVCCVVLSPFEGEGWWVVIHVCRCSIHHCHHWRRPALFLCAVVACHPHRMSMALCVLIIIVCPHRVVVSCPPCRCPVLLSLLCPRCDMLFGCMMWHLCEKDWEGEVSLLTSVRRCPCPYVAAGCHS